MEILMGQGGTPGKEQTVMQKIVSLCILGASLFAILSNHYDPVVVHWAYTCVGMILGYWLKQ